MKLTIEIPYWFVEICRKYNITSDVKILALAEEYYKIHVMKSQHSFKDIQNFNDYLSNLEKTEVIKHYQ